MTAAVDYVKSRYNSNLTLLGYLVSRYKRARQFQRSFVLADGVDVSGATMENGLLHVDLTRAQPETVVQRIKINKG